MYCPQCGATNDEGADSCGACGYDLSQYRQQWDGEQASQAPAGGEPEGPAGASAAGERPAGSQAPPYQAPGYGDAPTYQNQYRPGPYQGPPYQQQPHQQYYTTPPYQPNPYGPPPYGMRPHIPNYLGWAIAVLILCFWPTGIPAVVFASQVDNRLAMGDIEGARESSRKAKMWCWITFGISVGFWVIALVIFVLMVIVSAGIGGAIY